MPKYYSNHWRSDLAWQNVQQRPDLGCRAIHKIAAHSDKKLFETLYYDNQVLLSSLYDCFASIPAPFGMFGDTFAPSSQMSSLDQSAPHEISPQQTE